MMTSTRQLALVRERLGLVPGDRRFVVIDGASTPGLRDMLTALACPFECLYRGRLPDDILACAPYLIDASSAITLDWFVDELWGRARGILVESEADLRSLRRHFRTFLIVYDEQERQRHFRYYDPRVFRAYMPTLNTEEMRHVFGPVIRYFYEDPITADLITAEVGTERPMIDEQTTASMSGGVV